MRLAWFFCRYGLWQRRFAGDRNVAGQTLFLDGLPATVAGVLPRDFELPTLARVDLLVPQALDEAAQQRPRTGRVLQVFCAAETGSHLGTSAAGNAAAVSRLAEVGAAPVSERGEVQDAAAA